MAFNPHPFQQQNADLELKISQKMQTSNQLFDHKYKLRLIIPSALKNLSLLRLSELNQKKPQIKLILT